MKAKTLRLRMTAGLLGCAVAIGLTGTASAQPVKTVRVWHTETNPASQAAVAEIVKRFEASRPGVKIEAEALSWNDLEGKIMAALAAGSPPELSHGQPVTCAALLQQKLLLPIDDVVKAIGKSNIWEHYKKLCFADGKWYGLVHASGTSLMIYRKDLAKKLGIEPPKTWDDFVKIAEKLTIDENKDGKPEIYGLTMPGDNLFINILVGEMMAANGGKLFDEKNRPLFESRQMLETLDYWKRLAKFMPPGWEGHGYLDTFSNLYGQKAAMMYAGFGRGASLIEQYAPENMRNTETYDVWRKPHGPSGNAPASQVDEETWMLFKGSANPELAKEFLAFFYKDENYVEYIKSVPIHFFPITKSLRNSRGLPGHSHGEALGELAAGSAGRSGQGPGAPDPDHRLGGPDQQAVSAADPRLRRAARHGAGRRGRRQTGGGSRQARPAAGRADRSPGRFREVVISN